MRWNFAALLPAAVFLLTAPRALAQFGNLVAHIKPDQIASTLSQAHPQDLAKGVNTEKLADAIKSAAPAPEEAAQAIKEGSEKNVGRVARTIADAQQVASALKTAGEATSEGQVLQAPETSTLAPSTSLVVSASGSAAQEGPASSQQGSVVDALQTVSDAIQHAGNALNGSSVGGLNVSNPDAMAGALKEAVTKELPRAMTPDSIQKAQTGLGAAAKALDGNSNIGALKKAGQGLASAFHIPPPAQVPVPAAVQPQAVKVPDLFGEAIKHTNHAIKHADPSGALQALQQKGPKVLDAVREGKPDKLLPGGKPAPSVETKVGLTQLGEEGSGGMWLYLLGVCFMGAAIAGGWYLFTVYKHRDIRSPTLLTDAEMATWTSSSSSRGRQHAEEPLFRQF